MLQIYDIGGKIAGKWVHGYMLCLLLRERQLMDVARIILP